MMGKKFAKPFFSEFGWVEAEWGKRMGHLRAWETKWTLMGVKQGGTAGTSSRPCSLNATGVRAFLFYYLDSLEKLYLY